MTDQVERHLSVGEATPEPRPHVLHRHALLEPGRERFARASPRIARSARTIPKLPEDLRRHTPIVCENVAHSDGAHEGLRVLDVRRASLRKIVVATHVQEVIMEVDEKLPHVWS